MIKNVITLLLSKAFTLDKQGLHNLLEPRAFTPCSPEQHFTAGFEPMDGSDDSAFVKQVGKHFILRYTQEKKSVPAGLVKQSLKDMVKQIELDTGRAPGKSDMARLKENIVAQLMPRAFPKRTEMFIWFDTKNNTVNFDTSSSGRMEEALTLLIKTLGDEMQAIRIQTQSSPASAMTSWLLGETPVGIEVDDQCELVAGSANKPTIKYVRHDLSGQDVMDHLSEGKVPVNLGLTFKERLSFVLTDKFVIKSIAPLDYINRELEETDQSDQSAMFDASFLLMANEVGDLSNALIESMGGSPTDNGFADNHATEA